MSTRTTSKSNPSQSTALATFGAGCFWHVQLAFSNAKGVIKATAGYTGGDQSIFPKPTYEQVCSKAGGFIEVVQVEYDPTKTTYEALIEIFWHEHDPTSKDRQGLDRGIQYRSAIFYHTPEQKKIAEQAARAHEKKVGRPVVTEIRPAVTFFPAEDYHQDYLKKRGMNTCSI